jgi:acetyl esterase/lipase
VAGARLIGTIALLLGAAALSATVLATVRLRRPASLAFPFMMTSWLVGELAVFHLVLQIVAVGVLTLLGALDHTSGRVGLGLFAISIAALAVVQLRAGKAGAVFEQELEALGVLDVLDVGERAALTGTRRPFHFDMRGIEVERNLAYGDDPRHVLDIYRADGQAAAAGRPVVIYVHGGAWVIGNKEQQGKPLLLHLARSGYLAVTVNYRLAPRHKWPAQIVDVKRAIAWVREHVHEHGGDPSFVAISGSSAGGHLAALAALTPGDPEFQPGFEHADTSVDACVPIYAPFDLTDRAGRRGRASMRPFLERVVMTTKLRDDPDTWHAASPLWRVSPEAPPMFVIQGELDQLVWREEAREFVAELRDCSNAPVVFAEVPGAQHAFEVFNSVRSREAVVAIERFLMAVRSADGEHRRGS